jgi:hypothetical protein
MANNQLNQRSEHAPLQLLQASNEPLDTPKVPASGSNAGRSQLGADFKPSCYSVICGRGKGSYNHAGNHRFRELAKMCLKRYTRARTTADRLAVFAELVDMIHQTGGIFCMYEKAAWFEVGDHCAREKASALLRDMRFKYRSSKKVKPVYRRIQKEEKILPQIQQYSQFVPPQNQQYSHQKLPQNQQYVPQLVGSNGHSDDTTYTKQYVQQLIDGTSGHGDDYLSWGSNNRDLIEFENSLEYEDDFFDVFKIDSLHATRFTPSTPSAYLTY